MGCNKFFKPTIEIKLPGPGYIFTPEHVSDHDHLTIMHDKIYKYDAASGNPREVAPKTTVFCLFDLMVETKNEGQQFSKRPTLEDDFELD